MVTTLNVEFPLAFYQQSPGQKEMYLPKVFTLLESQIRIKMCLEFQSMCIIRRATIWEIEPALLYQAQTKSIQQGMWAERGLFKYPDYTVVYYLNIICTITFISNNCHNEHGTWQNI